jgi:hypothetical protein
MADTCRETSGCWKQVEPSSSTQIVRMQKPTRVGCRTFDTCRHFRRQSLLGRSLLAAPWSLAGNGKWEDEEMSGWRH